MTSRLSTPLRCHYLQQPGKKQNKQTNKQIKKKRIRKLICDSDSEFLKGQKCKRTTKAQLEGSEQERPLDFSAIFESVQK